VRYTVVRPLRDVVLCHCAMCRKTHGHVGAYTSVPKTALALAESRGLKWYRSSDKARRGFCGECGASLFWEPYARDYVAIAAGTLDEARHAARELATIADGLTSAAVQATAATAQGALHLAVGSPAAALEDLRRGLTGWRALGLPYEQAQARLLIGETQRRLGDEEGGRIEIDAARAEFDRLGAAADARRAAALLQRGRAPRAVLTAREVEVLRFVASGKSNRDIAGALQLSEHTVARHMQNILAKLGVSSRAAATSFALKQGLI